VTYEKLPIISRAPSAFRRSGSTRSPTGSAEFSPKPPSVPRKRRAPACNWLGRLRNSGKTLAGEGLQTSTIRCKIVPSFRSDDVHSRKDARVELRAHRGLMFVTSRVVPAALVFTTLSFAQDVRTATLAGTVTDPMGTAVLNGNVTARSRRSIPGGRGRLMTFPAKTHSSTTPLTGPA